MKVIMEVIETLSRSVEVEAVSAEDALDIIEQRYRAEEIVLDSGDFRGVNFIAKTDC